MFELGTWEWEDIPFPDPPWLNVTFLYQRTTSVEYNVSVFLMNQKPNQVYTAPIPHIPCLPNSRPRIWRSALSGAGRGDAGHNRKPRLSFQCQVSAFPCHPHLSQNSRPSHMLVRGPSCEMVSLGSASCKVLISTQSLRTLPVNGSCYRVAIHSRPFSSTIALSLFPHCSPSFPGKGGRREAAIGTPSTLNRRRIITMPIQGKGEGASMLGEQKGRKPAPAVRPSSRRVLRVENRGGDGLANRPQHPSPLTYESGPSSSPGTDVDLLCISACFPGWQPVFVP